MKPTITSFSVLIENHNLGDQLKTIKEYIMDVYPQLEHIGIDFSSSWV